MKYRHRRCCCSGERPAKQSNPCRVLYAPNSLSVVSGATRKVCAHLARSRSGGFVLLRNCKLLVGGVLPGGFGGVGTGRAAKGKVLGVRGIYKVVPHAGGTKPSVDILGLGRRIIRISSGVLLGKAPSSRWDTAFPCSTFGLGFEVGTRIELMWAISCKQLHMQPDRETGHATPPRNQTTLEQRTNQPKRVEQSIRCEGPDLSRSLHLLL